MAILQYKLEKEVEKRKNGSVIQEQSFTEANTILKIPTLGWKDS